MGLWVRTRLWAQVLAGMVLGVGLGLLLSPSAGALVSAPLAETLAAWLALPGKIFLALIQMIVIPLVLTSIILGVTSGGDSAFLRQVGSKVILFFVVTTALAVVVGILLTGAIEPGRFVDAGLLEQTMAEGEKAAAPVPVVLPEERAPFPDRIAALIPSNPAHAILDRAMLQIVIFSILLGIALIALPRDRARPLLDLLTAIQELSMQIVSWAMMLAPWAVFGLLAQITIRVGFDAIVGVSAYVGTVLLGLLILLVFYYVLAALLGRRSVFRFAGSIRDVQLLAFSTSSTIAVMPLSMRAAEERLGVRRSISQFVLPLGATVNMAGTAVYQAIAAVFLTQVFGIDLSTGDLVLLAATTVGASIGSPSAPGVGIVVLATILESLGVPASGIALIIGVDRILDMSRTSVNVTGDLVACVVMDRWVGRVVEATRPAGGRWGTEDPRRSQGERVAQGSREMRRPREGRGGQERPDPRGSREGRTRPEPRENGERRRTRGSGERRSGRSDPQGRGGRESGGRRRTRGPGRTNR